MTKEELALLDDEDFATLAADVAAESERRSELSRIPTEINRLTSLYLKAVGRDEGDAWSAPEGAHDAYPTSWEVTHNGKKWVSLVAGNVWKPGVSGWREVVPPDVTPAWVAPTGAHDAYALNAIVKHNEVTWKSTVAANVWEPGVYGWVQQ